MYTKHRVLSSSYRVTFSRNFSHTRETIIIFSFDIVSKFSVFPTLRVSCIKYTQCFHPISSDVHRHSTSSGRFLIRNRSKEKRIERLIPRRIELKAIADYARNSKINRDTSGGSEKRGEGVNSGKTGNERSNRRSVVELFREDVIATGK